MAEFTNSYSKPSVSDLSGFKTKPFVFSTIDSAGNDVCACPINKVTRNIFIGDHNAASNLNILNNYGITHIVNCAQEVKNYFETTHPKKLKYINLGLLDADDGIVPSVPEAYTYISSILLDNPDAKFLVHCHMGMSRSASMVLYYLMKTYRYDYDRALKLLKKCRPIVRPNDSYSDQLKNLFKK